MVRRAHTLGVLALVLSALLIAAAPAPASTFRGQNGEVAFLSSTANDCLQMVKPDGTGRHAPGACGTGFAEARISPDGTRVVAGVYNAADDVYDKRNTKLDGSDPIVIPGLYYELPFIRWSADGTLLAIAEQLSSACCDGGYLSIAPADGSGGAGTPVGNGTHGEWSNDGRFAYTWNDYDDRFGYLYAYDPVTQQTVTILSVTQQNIGEPEWSPGSQRLVFVTLNFPSKLAFINSDGTGFQQLATSGAAPEWAPDGQAILFQSNGEIHSMAPDGTGDTNLTNNPAFDRNAIWSPDSSKIAFESDRDGDTDIYVMNRDGSGVVQVTNDPGDERLQDWQSIPVNSYPRPKGATPTQVSMVPAYKQCHAAGRTHGPPLAYPSCGFPRQTSDELTVGTADSNGKPTKSRGLVRYDALLGNPATPADEADVQITVELSDVYRQDTLADYTGELRARSALRITDKLNTPAPGGPGAATVSDAILGATVHCTATADTTEGASCNLVTTFDALVPGTVTESKRSIWALGAAQLYDGGADSDGDTPADNTLFMTQGIFIP